MEEIYRGTYVRQNLKVRLLAERDDGVELLIVESTDIHDWIEVMTLLRDRELQRIAKRAEDDTAPPST